MIRQVLIVATILTLVLVAGAQSGRRKLPVTSAEPAPSPAPSEPLKKLELKTPPVTAEKNQDYRCTDDGSLAHLMDDPDSIKAFQPKEVDTRAAIIARPEPKYTDEARRVGVQGNVILKVLLATDGKIGRVRVLRRLPYGLTESAIRAACEIKFKPALINGQQVPQWVDVEYGFRLAKSSIFGP